MSDKNINRNIELYALIAELEGMKAENAFRETQGYAIAYGMDEFFELAERMRALIDHGASKENTVSKYNEANFYGMPTDME